MLSLSQLKQLHAKGMDYSTKHTPWFFPPITDLVNMQNQYVQNSKTLNQFMSAVSLAPPSFQAAFDVPKPICDSCMLGTTLPQYGQGSFGWYFLVGNFYLSGKPMAYNFTFTRVEIAPPAVVDLADRNEAVRWMVIGGYGSSPSDWVTIPYDFIYMKFTELSYSTFTLETIPSQPGEYISSCTLKSPTPMTVTFSLNFKDTTGKNHSVQSAQISQVPPQRNAPESIAKFGLPGLASLYWSYTDMNVTAVIDGVNFLGGKGWMDHQTFKVAGVMGFLPNSITSSQVLLTVLRTLTGGAQQTSWTWMYIQDMESGLQYMLSTALPKGYSDNPSTFKPGLKLKLAGCNVYKQGAPYINPSICGDTQIEVAQVQTVDGHPYPLMYNITLPGGKQVVSKAVYGLNLFTNPTGQTSCESVGVLFDQTGKTPIGYSILEINGPLSKEETARNALRNIGVPITNDAISTIRKGQDQIQPLNRKIIAWLITLFPMVLIIFFIVFIFIRKDQRFSRFSLSIAIILLLYLLTVIGMIMYVQYGERRNIVINTVGLENYPIYKTTETPRLQAAQISRDIVQLTAELNTAIQNKDLNGVAKLEQLIRAKIKGLGTLMKNYQQDFSSAEHNIFASESRLWADIMTYFSNDYTDLQPLGNIFLGLSYGLEQDLNSPQVAI